MKNLYYVFLVMIVTACSTEAVERSEADLASAAKKSSYSDDLVSNGANPYDYSGEAYLLLLDNYSSYQPKPSSSAGIGQTIESIGESMGFLNSNYIPQNIQAISSLQDLSVSDLPSAISQSGLSSAAQAYLLNCLNGLLALKSQDAAYEEAYSYLVNFESTVVSSNLDAVEKEVLLSAFSIVRYDIYDSNGRKRKDRDWELSAPNFMAAVHGAIQSVPNAIISTGISKTLE